MGFNSGFKGLIQINHQPDATIFQFIILTFVYRPVQPRTQHDCHHDTKLKLEAATAVIELLLMGGGTPETCWAVNKRQDNKLENCCISLVIYLNCTMLHGLTKLKKSDRGFLFSEAVANISLWIRKFYKQI